MRLQGELRLDKKDGGAEVERGAAQIPKHIKIETKKKKQTAPDDANPISPWVIMFSEDINSEVWRSWWVSNEEL